MSEQEMAVLTDLASAVLQLGKDVSALQAQLLPADQSAEMAEQPMDRVTADELIRMWSGPKSTQSRPTKGLTMKVDMVMYDAISELAETHQEALGQAGRRVLLAGLQALDISLPGFDPQS